ncbi:hypothetical protein A2U01_0097024, partial [Trifolium medium]|nr:hypothetical protein [Trifolium medium]
WIPLGFTFSPKWGGGGGGGGGGYGGFIHLRFVVRFGVGEVL